MQRELASMLHQKNRLAALGLAVSKINHDLRNLLASAQLFSDQLSNLPDPKVQRFAPKLMRALERAIAFCQSTLSYGAAQEAAPDRKTIDVEPLIEEVHEALGLGLEVPIRWIVAVEARPDRGGRSRSVVRALVNVTRNAVQALEARGARDPARDQIRITGRREGTVAVIEGVRHRTGRVRPRARPHVPGVSGLDTLGRHGPGARDRGRTGAGAWRRHPPGAGNHRRHLQHLDSRSRGRSEFPSRQTRAGVKRSRNKAGPRGVLSARATLDFNDGTWPGRRRR